jgi:hypothetical protein
MFRLRLFAITTLVSLALISAEAATQPAGITWGKDAGGVKIGYMGFPTTSTVGTPIGGAIVIENTGNNLINFIRRLKSQKK